MSGITSGWTSQCAISLSAAFQSDLAMQYIFPDPARRSRQLPKLYRALARATDRSGFILRTRQGEAVSLWRKPGMAHDGILQTLCGAPAFLGALGPSVIRALSIDKSISQHLPPQPFYYLQILGTHPDHHGKGLGGALLRAGIKRAEEDNSPVVLETSRTENISIYNRFGFEINTEWVDPNSNLHFYGMVRSCTNQPSDG